MWIVVGGRNPQPKRMKKVEVYIDKGCEKEYDVRVV